MTERKTAMNTKAEVIKDIIRRDNIVKNGRNERPTSSDTKIVNAYEKMTKHGVYPDSITNDYVTYNDGTTAEEFKGNNGKEYVNIPVSAGAESGLSDEELMALSEEYHKDDISYADEDKLVRRARRNAYYAYEYFIEGIPIHEESVRKLTVPLTGSEKESLTAICGELGEAFAKLGVELSDDDSIFKDILDGRDAYKSYTNSSADLNYALRDFNNLKANIEQRTLSIVCRMYGAGQITDLSLSHMSEEVSGLNSSQKACLYHLLSDYNEIVKSHNMVWREYDGKTGSQLDRECGPDLYKMVELAKTMGDYLGDRKEENYIVAKWFIENHSMNETAVKNLGELAVNRDVLAAHIRKDNELEHRYLSEKSDVTDPEILSNETALREAKFERDIRKAYEDFQKYDNENPGSVEDPKLLTNHEMPFNVNEYEIILPNEKNFLERYNTTLMKGREPLYDAIIKCDYDAGLDYRPSFTKNVDTLYVRDNTLMAKSQVALAKNCLTHRDKDICDIMTDNPHTAFHDKRLVALQGLLVNDNIDDRVNSMTNIISFTGSSSIDTLVDYLADSMKRGTIQSDLTSRELPQKEWITRDLIYNENIQPWNQKWNVNYGIMLSSVLSNETPPNYLYQNVFKKWANSDLTKHSMYPESAVDVLIDGGKADAISCYMTTLNMDQLSKLTDLDYRRYGQISDNKNNPPDVRDEALTECYLTQLYNLADGRRQIIGTPYSVTDALANAGLVPEDIINPSEDKENAKRELGLPTTGEYVEHNTPPALKEAIKRFNERELALEEPER